MTLVDITSDFLSLVEDTHISYNQSWNTSNFLKSANSALQDMITLQIKTAQLKKIVKSSSRFDKEKNNKMFMNIKQGIKNNQQSIKRLMTFQTDMKANYRLGQQFKQSMLAALEFRLLKVSFQFKQAYEQNVLKGKGSFKRISNANSGQNNQHQINLNKSYFLSQTQQQLMEQTAINEYKDIQKSINNVFSMYKESLNAVKMHDLLIDSIQNNIQYIDGNVIQGKKNISEVHRRQSKNRSLIIKMFTTLYVITFIYIVFLC